MKQKTFRVKNAVVTTVPNEITKVVFHYKWTAPNGEVYVFTYQYTTLAAIPIPFKVWGKESYQRFKEERAIVKDTIEQDTIEQYERFMKNMERYSPPSESDRLKVKPPKNFPK